MGRKSSSKRRRADLAENENAVHESAAQPRPPQVTAIADHFLNELAQQTMAALNASAVAIAIDVDGAMTCRGRSGTLAPEIGTPVQRDRGITGECVRTGAVVRCADALHDPRVDSAVCEQLQIGSILLAPLLRNGQAVGVIEAFFILPNSFDDIDVEFLQGVAQQVVARVWGEESPTQPETSDEPANAVAAGVEEPSAWEATADEEEAVFVEPSAEERRDVALSEDQSGGAVQNDSEAAPVSRTRMIMTAVATLIIIAIAIVAYAHWNKVALTPKAPAVSKQPTQPVAEDPMAELRRAAEAGDTAAEYKLARAYKEGSGVKADPQQAKVWLRTAAEYGNPDAQLEWARTLEKSDPVEAYTWYVIAGHNGRSASESAIRRLTPKLTPPEIAQVRLEVGRQYLAGHALPRDPVAAYVWFRLSEEGGNTTAGSEMQHLRSRLSGRQVRQAEARASEWIRKHTAPAASNQNAAADVQP